MALGLSMLPSSEKRSSSNAPEALRPPPAALAVLATRRAVSACSFARASAAAIAAARASSSALSFAASSRAFLSWAAFLALSSSNFF